jgi:hypothetical protein
VVNEKRWKTLVAEGFCDSGSEKFFFKTEVVMHQFGVYTSGLSYFADGGGLVTVFTKLGGCGLQNLFPACVGAGASAGTYRRGGGGRC